MSGSSLSAKSSHTRLLVVYGIPKALITQRWLNDLAAFAGFAATRGGKSGGGDAVRLGQGPVGQADGGGAADPRSRVPGQLRAGRGRQGPGRSRNRTVPAGERHLLPDDRVLPGGTPWAGIHGHHVTPTICQTDLEHFRRLVSGEISSYRREKRHRRKDGTVAWVLVAATALRDERGHTTLVLGDILDITNDKAAAERLRESEAAQRTAKEEAQRASAAKSRFLAAASHDLRQPLQSLILFTGVLKGYVQGPRGEQALKHLEAWSGRAEGVARQSA